MTEPVWKVIFVVLTITDAVLMMTLVVLNSRPDVWTVGETVWMMSYDVMTDAEGVWTLIPGV
jgi:hypothetical protein